MSWDVLIVRSDGKPEQLRRLREHHRPPPLGDAEEIRRSIADVWPQTDWSDLSWGILEETDEYTIEFNLPKAGPVETLMLHVRGGGAATKIADLCRRNGWCAFDTSTGEWMDLNTPPYARGASFPKAGTDVESLSPAAHSERAQSQQPSDSVPGGSPSSDNSGTLDGRLVGAWSGDATAMITGTASLPLPEVRRIAALPAGSKPRLTIVYRPNGTFETRFEMKGRATTTTGTWSVMNAGENPLTVAEESQGQTTEHEISFTDTDTIIVTIDERMGPVTLTRQTES